MTTDVRLDSELWERFQQEAKQRRRNPANLLRNYMRECLAIWEDQKLDEQMRRDARRSGYREEDAVELVRQVRREMRAERAAP
jgi:predicted transcriptional regulator